MPTNPTMNRTMTHYQSILDNLTAIDKNERDAFDEAARAISERAQVERDRVRAQCAAIGHLDRPHREFTNEIGVSAILGRPMLRCVVCDALRDA